MNEYLEESQKKPVEKFLVDNPKIPLKILRINAWWILQNISWRKFERNFCESPRGSFLRSAERLLMQWQADLQSITLEVLTEFLVEKMVGQVPGEIKCLKVNQ